MYTAVPTKLSLISQLACLKTHHSLTQNTKRSFNNKPDNTVTSYRNNCSGHSVTAYHNSRKVIAEKIPQDRKKRKKFSVFFGCDIGNKFLSCTALLLLGLKDYCSLLQAEEQCHNFFDSRLILRCDFNPDMLD